MSDRQSMTVQDASTSVRPDDVVLDVCGQSSQLLDFAQRGSRFVVAAGDRFELSESPGDAATTQFSESASVGRLVETLKNQTVRRVLCSVMKDGEAPEPLREELTRNGIELIEVIVSETVRADDFMDEADSDAVAERLRQLGYI